MTTSDLEGRLAELEWKDEVRAAIARYCLVNDRLDNVGELVDLFAANATLVNPSGEYVGRDAIAQYYRGFFEDSTEFAHHQVVNQVIDILEPGVARHQSSFLAFLGKGGESRLAFGRYDDTLVKVDRDWLFVRKINDVVGVTTLGQGWAHGLGAWPPSVRR